MRKQDIAVTVDAVIISKGEQPKILLVQRGNDPYKGDWALPGGFLEEDETLEEGAKRELEEETGLLIKTIKQIGAFGNPGRDPRGRTISIAFLGTVESPVEVKGDDDAAEAKWFKLSQLPELAFDHQRIIETALTKLKEDHQ